MASVNSPCTDYVALLAQNMAIQWETARVISLDRERATTFLEERKEGKLRKTFFTSSSGKAW